MAAVNEPAWPKAAKLIRDKHVSVEAIAPDWGFCVLLNTGLRVFSVSRHASKKAAEEHAGVLAFSLTHMFKQVMEAVAVDCPGDWLPPEFRGESDGQ